MRLPILAIPPFVLLTVSLVACGDTNSDASATGGAAGASGSGGSAGAAGGGGSAGCGGGGCGCTYQDIVGQATITSIDPINGVCPDPQLPSYDFAADDSSIPPDSYDPAKFGFSAGFETISLPGGKGLPKSCLDPSGIVLDAKIPMTRRVIQTGSCTPVIDVLDLDLSLCETQCP